MTSMKSPTHYNSTSIVDETSRHNSSTSSLSQGSQQLPEKLQIAADKAGFLAMGRKREGQVYMSNCDDEGPKHGHAQDGHNDTKKKVMEGICTEKEENKKQCAQGNKGEKEGWHGSEQKNAQQDCIMRTLDTTCSTITDDANNDEATCPEGTQENDNDTNHEKNDIKEHEPSEQHAGQRSNTHDRKRKLSLGGDEDGKKKVVRPKIVTSLSPTEKQQNKDMFDPSKKDTTTSVAAATANTANTVTTSTTTATEAPSIPPAKNGSSLGRRGDPRMHRAVAARLAKPGISLFQALIIGGFEFPDHINEISIKYSNEPIYDSDKILLSQRKNQLSRRLRHLRQRDAKSQVYTAQEKGQVLVPTIPMVSAMQHENRATANGLVNLDSKRNILTPGMGNNTFSLPSIGGHQYLLPNNAFYLPNYQGANFQQQHMQHLLKYKTDQQLLQEQLNFYATSTLADNILPQSSNFATTMQHISPLSYGNVSNFPQINNPQTSRMEHSMSVHDSERKELGRRALVAAGFKESEIDESVAYLKSLNETNSNQF